MPGVRISEFMGELKCEDEKVVEGVVPLDKPELGYDESYEFVEEKSVETFGRPEILSEGSSAFAGKVYEEREEWFDGV
jgi:hypothetical protein